jgi:hypothetical protein
MTSTIWGDPEHVDNVKVWRWLYITVEAMGAWNMELAYAADFSDGVGQSELIDLDPGGAAWGAAFWGVAAWGAGVTKKKVKIIFKNCVSKSIQLKFKTNALNQYWRVHDVELWYSLRGVR